MVHVKNARLRPTFTIPVALPREEAVEAVREAFDRRTEFSGRWRGKGRWTELHVPSGDERIWSPFLSIRADADGRTTSLFARFSPSASVWTFFMFVYGGVVFLVVFGAIFGYVQYVSGTSAWAFWSVWIGIPVICALHGVSWLGKRLGYSQMVELKRELESVLADLGDAVV